MLFPIVCLIIAVASAGYVAVELLRGVADYLGYLTEVRRFGDDLAWWIDARFSIIPAEQHAAVEVLADLYGIEPATR